MPNPQPQPKPQKLMSRQEFLDRVRKEVPELKDFSDIVLMNEILKRRPELKNQVENPLAGDEAAAREQSRTLARSKSLIDPDYWKQNPNLARFSKGVLDTLPSIGAITGGSPGALSMMAAPFSGGTSIPVSAGLTAGGAALGAGAGRGLRDISAQVLGLEQQSSPLDKARNIGLDAGIAAITPGVVEALKNPIQTARMGVGAYSKLFPRNMQGWLEPQFLQDFAAGPKMTRGPIMPDFPPEVPTVDATPVEQPIKEGIFHEIPRKALPPSNTSFYNPESFGSDTAYTPGGNPQPSNAAPSNAGPTASSTPSGIPTGSVPASASGDIAQHAADTAKHVVLTRGTVGTVAKHLKGGTKILVKSKDATPDVVREAIDSGFSFDGLSDEGHFRFTKVGE